MMQLEKKVLLLGIYTKEDDESVQDVLLKLEETGMFTLKEAKKLLKELKEEDYLEGSTLTLKGFDKGKEIAAEFKI